VPRTISRFPAEEAAPLLLRQVVAEEDGMVRYKILRGLGRLAGAHADDVVIAEKRHYLRGRGLDEMNELMRAGIYEGGYVGLVESYHTELDALQALIGRSRRGDVVAVMTHAQRAELFEWLEKEGYRPVAFDRLRALVGA
jgi:cyanophycin synthetase